MTTTVPAIYAHDQIKARRHIFKLFGASFDLWSLEGEMLAYSKQKAFRLKEDIRVYADLEQKIELLNIQADRVIDFAASYSVIDSTTGEKIGSLRRKGWASIMRDTWELLDPEGIVRGKVVEDSGWLAFLRRFVDFAALIFPQKFLIEVDGIVVATMKQNHNFFAPKFHVDLSLDTGGLLPRPLAIATVILLLAIEGRQA